MYKFCQLYMASFGSNLSLLEFERVLDDSARQQIGHELLYAWQSSHIWQLTAWRVQWLSTFFRNDKYDGTCFKAKVCGYSDKPIELYGKTKLMLP